MVCLWLTQFYSERQHVHIPGGGVEEGTPGFKWQGWLKDFFRLENFGKYFLGGLIYEGIFLGIQNNLKILW